MKTKEQESGQSRQRGRVVAGLLLVGLVPVAASFFVVPGEGLNVLGLAVIMPTVMALLLIPNRAGVARGLAVVTGAFGVLIAASVPMMLARRSGRAEWMLVACLPFVTVLVGLGALLSSEWFHGRAQDA